MKHVRKSNWNANSHGSGFVLLTPAPQFIDVPIIIYCPNLKSTQLCFVTQSEFYRFWPRRRLCLSHDERFIQAAVTEQCCDSSVFCVWAVRLLSVVSVFTCTQTELCERHRPRTRTDKVLIQQPACFYFGAPFSLSVSFLTTQEIWRFSRVCLSASAVW